MNSIMGAFTGFDGRLNRQRWWISVIILAIVGFIIFWILGAIFGVGLMMTPTTDPAAMQGYVQKVGWVGVVVAIILAYPQLAIGIKRRHDRNNNGYDVVGFVVIDIIVNLLNGLGITVGPLAGVLGLVILVYGIYLLVVLGFLKGTAGSNNYGADPLQG